VAETDSAANHYGQLRAENPRHHLRFLWPVSALAFVGSLDKESDYENPSHTTGRIEHEHDLVDHQLSLSTVRGKNVGIPM
jgi:hypothetical protein